MFQTPAAALPNTHRLNSPMQKRTTAIPQYCCLLEKPYLKVCQFGVIGSLQEWLKMVPVCFYLIIYLTGPSLWWIYTIAVCCMCACACACMRACVSVLNASAEV